MLLVVRVVLALVMVVVVAAFIVSFLKSVLGKPVRGTLHIPRGKTSVKVDVFDERPLRPFRYGQAFDVVLSLPEQTLTSMYTGQARTGTGVVSFKGTPVGFVSGEGSHVQALMLLAERYPKLIVQGAVMGMDPDDRPDIELLLPEATWFAKALKESEEKR